MFYISALHQCFNEKAQLKRAKAEPSGFVTATETVTCPRRRRMRPVTGTIGRRDAVTRPASRRPLTPQCLTDGHMCVCSSTSLLLGLSLLHAWGLTICTFATPKIHV